jgi:hypothetical protein
MKRKMMMVAAMVKVKVAMAMATMAMLACGARPLTMTAGSQGDEVRMYRDRALIEQRVVIAALSAGRTTVLLQVPADVGPAEIVVVDLGGLGGSQIRRVAVTAEAVTVEAVVAAVAAAADADARAAAADADAGAAESDWGVQRRDAGTAPVDAGAGPVTRPDDPLDSDTSTPANVDDDEDAKTETETETDEGTSVDVDVDVDVDDDDERADAGTDARRPATDGGALAGPRSLGTHQPPSTLELVVDAPRAGRFVVTLGYATQLVRWEAAYTITTSPAHDHARLRGTVTIQNSSGVALRARTSVVDAELGAWEERWAEQLRAALAGVSPAQVAVRDLGVVAIAEGETRVELLSGDETRGLRSVLVYDAIGPELDHTGAAPVSDPELGVRTHMATQITESVELERNERTDRGLPGGHGTLVERSGDGALMVLGTARLFDGGAQVARAETVGIGKARGLVGHRARRDWGKNNDQRRFSEEFLVTVASTRPHPVEVVIREHLYRGQNWTLAYQSAPAKKEGPQQIALRATVPANGEVKVLYVVVYTW